MLRDGQPGVAFSHQAVHPWSSPRPVHVCPRVLAAAAEDGVFNARCCGLVVSETSPDLRSAAQEKRRQ